MTDPISSFFHRAVGPTLELPSGKRAPFGLPSFAVPAPGGGSVELHGYSGPIPNAASRSFRITTAIDDRECKRISVTNFDGILLGEFDLRYAHALETFEIVLPDPVDVSAGLWLTMTVGSTPLWCVAPGSAQMSPHLIRSTPPDDPVSALLGHLRSPECIHAWGWMEGCVLDGLERLSSVYLNDGYTTAIKAHLGRFFTEAGGLISETPRSEVHDDAIDNIESTLMFAPLAAIHPSHPWIDRVIDYWQHESGTNGIILDDSMLSAEGSYTIAYPMARIAALRGDAALAAAALRQLEVRRKNLWYDGNLWLRWYPATGERTFCNWARGITWHFLGSVRTAQELEVHGNLLPLMNDIHALADLALRTQRDDGLWNCFIDDPDGLPETSGSAGIATALAIAGNAGWIDSKTAISASRRTLQGLLPYITGDGRLSGVSQSNRGGEQLQRSDYRVLSAMGAGLAAQLIAALDSSPKMVC